MADDNDILIDEDGTTIRFVYSDLLDQVFADETRTTQRASHVEPLRWSNGWYADMGPSGGPVLLGPDGDGFPTRQEALNAERAWLRKERGL